MLPDPADPDFEGRVRDYALAQDRPETAFRRILEDETDEVKKFAALYGLLQELHREQRFDEYRLVCETHQDAFGHLPYFLAFRANVASGDGTSDTGLRQALRLLDEAIRRLPDRSGLLHQYAAACASLIELGERVHSRTIDLALDRVERAIDLAPEPTNPIYYFTRARLLRALGRIGEALTEVRAAISSQESRTPGGVRRLARFESLRSVLVVDKSNERLLEEIESARDELRATRGEQIQLLGVLAAVIALITTSVSISQQIPEASAIGFLLVTAGAIGVVFSGLSWAASTASAPRLLAPLVASMAMIVVGVLVWPAT